MTSRERILRMFQHKEADRIPIVDKPWGQDTLDRWVADGMPAGADYQDYFGFDITHSIPNNVSAQDLKRILDVVRAVGRYE